jgi:hypothetical protein
MSKNIPYTVETLAIEFNRSVDKVELALKIFIELEMIEFTEDNIYRVKNFVKHQNIKVKEKIKFECKQEDNSSNNKTDIAGKDMNGEMHGNRNKTFVNEIDQTGNIDRNDKSQILLKMSPNKRKGKKKKKDTNINAGNGEVEDSGILCFYDGDMSLNEGESVVEAWAF